MIHVIIPCQAGDSLRDALITWRPYYEGPPRVSVARPNGLELWVPLEK